jgi:RES domain-containing protein
MARSASGFVARVADGDNTARHQGKYLFVFNDTDLKRVGGSVCPHRRAHQLHPLLNFTLAPRNAGRIVDDREHKEKYTAAEVGAPPHENAKAGRANQAQQPVLYLASNRSTALAEVRPWKGAAVAIAEVKTKQRLLLVDLSQVRPVKSPFFTDLLKWRIDLANLLYRLGQDMSRPVMPHEREILYKPTQLLALMIQATRYDGCIYPSAMGSRKNYVLFDTQAVEVLNIEHVRVRSATFFSKPLGHYEEIFEEGPYDHMVKRR